MKNNLVRLCKAIQSSDFDVLGKTATWLYPTTSDLRVRGSSPLERAKSNTFKLTLKMHNLCAIYHLVSSIFRGSHGITPAGDRTAKLHFQAFSSLKSSGGIHGGGHYCNYQNLGQMELSQGYEKS
jgi:hypothetical protein